MLPFAQMFVFSFTNALAVMYFSLLFSVIINFRIPVLLDSIPPQLIKPQSFFPLLPVFFAQDSFFSDPFHRLCEPPSFLLATGLPDALGLFPSFLFWTLFCSRYMSRKRRCLDSCWFISGQTDADWLFSCIMLTVSLPL